MAINTIYTPWVESLGWFHQSFLSFIAEGSVRWARYCCKDSRLLPSLYHSLFVYCEDFKVHKISLIFIPFVVNCCITGWLGSHDLLCHPNMSASQTFKATTRSVVKSRRTLLHFVTVKLFENISFSITSFQILALQTHYGPYLSLGKTERDELVVKQCKLIKIPMQTCDVRLHHRTEECSAAVILGFTSFTT